MNFSQIADTLHMTRAGARNLVLKNQNKLKKYLIIENKKIIGINDNGIEPLRNCRTRKTNTDYKKSFEIEKLKIEIDNLKNENKLLNDLIENNKKTFNILENQIEDLRNENIKLNSELSYYENLNFFQRLLNYKNKK